MSAALKVIEEYAFEGCSFYSVRIPDGCTTIGAKAFAHCPNLTYVYIPASVTYIDDTAFDNCDSLFSFQTTSRNTAAARFAEKHEIQHSY